MPFISLAIVSLIVGLHFIPGSFDLLAFNRSSVHHGEFYRFLTGNFVHGSLEHLVRDSAALLVIGPLIENRIGKVFWGYLVASSVCITLAYFWFVPTIKIYFGISGVISGLFGIFLMLELPKRWRQKSWLWCIGLLLSLAFFFAKTSYELLAQTSLLYRQELGAAPLAHFLGFLSGVICGGIVSVTWKDFTTKIPVASLYVCALGVIVWTSAVLWWPKT